MLMSTIKIFWSCHLYMFWTSAYKHTILLQLECEFEKQELNRLFLSVFCLNPPHVVGFLLLNSLCCLFAKRKGTAWKLEVLRADVSAGLRGIIHLCLPLIDKQLANSDLEPHWAFLWYLTHSLTPEVLVWCWCQWFCIYFFPWDPFFGARFLLRSTYLSHISNFSELSVIILT